MTYPARQPLLAPRRWPRRLLILANTLVALCLIGAASAYGYVQWRLGQIHREHIAGLTGIGGGKPFTVLIVGSDTRAALAQNGDNSAFGGASVTPGQRSDTIIVARIAPATRQMMLMSIPRDLWVNIPGHGMNRINSAFDTGAPLLIQAIQTDLGIPINHYVEVNFDTFRDIANAVGGVSIYFPTPARDHFSLLNVTHAGCNLLTGDQALAFVRSRHYEYYQNGEWHFEAESDLARVQRQQGFIKKLLKKAEGEFTNPLALNDVIAGVTKNLTVDSGLSNNALIALARTFRSIDPSSIPSLTLPNYPFTTSGGAEVLGLQQPQAGQTIAAFNSFGNARPTTTTAPAVHVNPASVHVEVVNGTGYSGQAAAMAKTLSAGGYQATTITNLGTSGIATTEVHYVAKSLDAARQVAAAIPGGATLVADNSLAAGPYQLEVVTGASFSPGAPTGSTGATGGGSTAGAPGATATTLPGQVTSYTLPGTPPGEVPPSC